MRREVEQYVCALRALAGCPAREIRCWLILDSPAYEGWRDRCTRRIERAQSARARMRAFTINELDHWLVYLKEGGRSP